MSMTVVAMVFRRGEGGPQSYFIYLRSLSCRGLWATEEEEEEEGSYQFGQL